MIPWLVGTTASGIIAAVTVAVAIAITITIAPDIKVTSSIIATSLIVLVLLHWPIATSVVLHRSTIRPLIHGKSLTTPGARSTVVLSVELAFTFPWW